MRLTLVAALALAGCTEAPERETTGESHASLRGTESAVEDLASGYRAWRLDPSRRVARGRQPIWAELVLRPRGGDALEAELRVVPLLDAPELRVRLLARGGLVVDERRDQTLRVERVHAGQLYTWSLRCRRSERGGVLLAGVDLPFPHANYHLQVEASSAGEDGVPEEHAPPPEETIGGVRVRATR